MAKMYIKNKISLSGKTYTPEKRKTFHFIHIKNKICQKPTWKKKYGKKHILKKKYHSNHRKKVSDDFYTLKIKSNNIKSHYKK